MDSSPSFYCKIDGEERGPLTRSELEELVRADRLSPDDEIRKSDSSKWRPASKLKGLFSKPKKLDPPRNVDAELACLNAILGSLSPRNQKVLLGQGIMVGPWAGRESVRFLSGEIRSAIQRAATEVGDAPLRPVASMMKFWLTAAVVSAVRSG